MRKINEIFYSIQGEGFNVGTPAVFVRFAGCNLNCKFCDTDFKMGDVMTDEEIINNIKRYPGEWVILTGGEPSLFIDEKFIQKIKETGKRVAIETNGTQLLPSNIDWVTVSPKDDFCENAEVVVKKANEVKVIYTHSGQDVSKYPEMIKADHYYLQPCGSGEKNNDMLITGYTVNYVMQHPLWHLSVQTHKFINIR